MRAVSFAIAVADGRHHVVMSGERSACGCSSCVLSGITSRKSSDMPLVSAFYLFMLDTALGCPSIFTVGLFCVDLQLYDTCDYP